MHWSPGQHASSVPPQGWHDVPVHTSEPPEHWSPLERHTWVVGSQHPFVHASVEPVQQVAPG